MKDTREVWSDHGGFKGRRRVVSLLKHYGNDVIPNVPLSLHLPHTQREKTTLEKDVAAVQLKHALLFFTSFVSHDQPCSKQAAATSFASFWYSDKIKKARFLGES